MYDVKAPGILRASAVSDPVEIERLRWFQTTRYAQSGLIDEIPLELPHDPDQEASVYYAVYGPGDEIWATARLICRPLDQLPVGKVHQLNADALDRIERNECRVAEFSRLAVATKAPKFEVLSELCKLMLQHSVVHHEHTLWVASVNKVLLRILNRVIFAPCKIIGPLLADYYNESNYPVEIDALRFLNEARYQNARTWSYFTEGLTIDVTDPDRVTIDVTDPDRVTIDVTDPDRVTIDLTDGTSDASVPQPEFAATAA